MRHKDRVAKKMKGLKRKKCSTRRHSRTYLTRRMGPHDESHTHQQPAAQAHRDHYSHGNAAADTDTVDEKADATPTPAHRPTHKRHDDPPTTPPTATTSASEHDVYTTTAVPHAEPNNKCPARRTKKHTLPGPLGERRRSPLMLTTSQCSPDQWPPAAFSNAPNGAREDEWRPTEDEPPEPRNSDPLQLPPPTKKLK